MGAEPNSAPPLSIQPEAIYSSACRNSVFGWRDQGISRFDCWSLSVKRCSRQLSLDKAGQGECLTLTSRHDTICTSGHLILSRVEALSDVQQRVEPGVGSFEFYPAYRGSPARDNRIDSCRAALVATRPGSRVSRAAGEKL